MNVKPLAVLSVALLLLGLGLGYLMWGRGTTELRNELGRANARLAEQSGT